VALTPFQAMAGFRSPGEISALLGPELCNTFNFKGQKPEELRSFVRQVFSIKGDAYQTYETGLRVRSEGLLHSNSGKEREAAAMVLDLQSLYPHDPGQFGPLLFNILNLKPGEGLFVPAGVIHAYVKGSILEIMACSDNVIRAGLTIKYIDVDLLCDILKPHAKPALIRPEYERFDWGSRADNATPAREFRLECLEVQAIRRVRAFRIAPSDRKSCCAPKGAFTSGLKKNWNFGRAHRALSPVPARRLRLRDRERYGAPQAAGKHHERRHGQIPRKQSCGRSERARLPYAHHLGRCRLPSQGHSAFSDKAGVDPARL
jgi:hypothetical protein